MPALTDREGDKGGIMKKKWKQIDWRMNLSREIDSSDDSGTVYADGFRSGIINIKGWKEVSVPLKMKENMVEMGVLDDPWNHILIRELGGESPRPGAEGKMT